MFADRDAADGISTRYWVLETDDADGRGYARAMCTCVIPLTYDEAAAALGVPQMGAARDSGELHIRQRRAGQHARVLAL